MTNQGQTLPLFGLLRRESTSDQGLDTKQSEEVWRDPDPTDVLRLRSVGERDGNGVPEGHIRETSASAPPLFDIPICRSAFAHALSRDLAPQHRQMFWGSIRKWPEENRIQRTKHCRIGTNRQRQYAHGGSGKSRALAESSHREAYILRRRID